MSSKFITDKEIDLSKSDFLKTKVYADNLVDIIKNTEQDKVFTVGLYGNWGSGKSSIIETAKYNFDVKKDKLKFITYDAWQYSNDSFRRMFLRCLSKELKYSETDFMQRFYENESRDIDNEFKLSYTKSTYTLISILVILVILSFIDIKIDIKITVFSIITVLGTLVALFSGIFHQLKISVTKPYIFAPEQFEDCFKEIANKALKENSIIDKLKYINDCDYTIKDLNKLVIVIDNIDRCNSDVAYQLLTDIKTFLGGQKFSIVFIIPVDDKALLKNFFSNTSNGKEHNDKEEFLRKIFNVTLRIKPYSATDMFAFTKSICSVHNLNFKNETINIIGKEYSSNPRRVIQLINNLIVELNNYHDEFAIEYQTIICCILIIREEYPEFYELIYKNASLLINYEDSQFSELLTEEKRNEVHRFMRIASNEFRESKNSILNKVLMNSNNRFSGIPAEVIDSIETFNSEYLSKFFIENKDVNEEIYNYLCHKIDEAHDNNLINDLSEYLSLTSIINGVKPIPKEYLYRVFEKFKSKLETIFNHCENININILLKLVEFENNDFNKYKLKKILFGKIQINVNSTEINFKNKWINILNSVFQNLTDNETSEKLKDEYDKFYTEILKAENLNNDQFKVLVNKKFISNRIKEFNNDNIDINDEKYKLIKHIFGRIDNKLFVVEILFAKLNSNEIFKDDENNRYNYIVLFNDFINYSKDFINNYKGKYLKSNLISVFNNLEFYKNNLDVEKKDFLEVIKDDKEKLQIILDLILNYYNFTLNLDIVKDYILKINNYIPRETREQVVNLMNDNKDISFYYQTVSNSFDFEDKNLISLFKYYLTYPDQEFQDRNLKTSEKIIESLMADLEEDGLRNIINETFEYLIDKTNSFHLIFNEFQYKLEKNETNFLNMLSKKLREAFAKEIQFNDNINLSSNDLLEFCFSVNDDSLNIKIAEKLSTISFNIPLLNSFLKVIIVFLESNKEKEITKIISEKIIEISENDRFNLRRNTPVIKELKENITKIKNLI